MSRCPLGYGPNPSEAVMPSDPSATPGTAEPDPAKAAHYGSYLAIEQLLRLQSGPTPTKPHQSGGVMHHEELMFIIVHQVFELWFKMILADLSQVRNQLQDLSQSRDFSMLTGSPQLTKCLQFLHRTSVIFQHMQGNFAVMETMHPGDFLEFRDYLAPASGFQSVAFRSLEQLLGISPTGRARIDGATVFSFLTAEERRVLEAEQACPSLADVVMKLLQEVSVPAAFGRVFLETNAKILRMQQYDLGKCRPGDPQAEAKVAEGEHNVASILEYPLAACDGVLLEASDEQRANFKKAFLAALFVTSYRAEPQWALLAQLLDGLIDLEEGLLLWRSRHTHMAERMIGRRVGTAGTSGIGYLEITHRYRIFHPIWLVRKVLIRSSLLPPSHELK